MAITYKSAGSGVATETSAADLGPLCPATVDAGDILIAHVYWEATTTTPSTPTGWTLLSGPHVIETSVSRHWVFGKIADGTEDGAAASFGAPAVTTQRGARIYSFAGYLSGTIYHVVRGFAHTSNAADPTAPSVTTLKAGSLAVLLIGQNDNNTLANFTGESGGDYTEAVAEFTANLTPGLGLGLQASAMAAAGTITGGSDNTQNDPAGVIGFEIADAPVYVVSDAITVADDGVSLKLLLSLSVFDAVTVAEDVVLTREMYMGSDVTVLEDVTVAVVAGSNAVIIAASDDVTVVEATTLLLTNLVPAVSEAVTITEDTTLLLTTIVPAVNDAVTLEDAPTLRMSVYLYTVFDALTVAEDAPVSLVTGSEAPLTPAVSDDLTVTESALISIPLLSITVEESVTVLESSSISMSLPVSSVEAVAVTELVSVQFTPLLTDVFDTLTVADWVNVSNGDAVLQLTIDAFDTVTLTEDLPEVRYGHRYRGFAMFQWEG